MTWTIVATEAFSREFKKQRKNQEMVRALEQKLKRLQEDPASVGGYLSGRLHGFKSTRLVGKYRLVFKIAEAEHAVHLIAIDHRKFDYERFDAE